MSAREVFSVAVRIIGLLICLAALLYLLTASLLFVDPEYFTKYRPGTSLAPVQHYLLNGLIYLAVGVYFMRGGGLVVRLAFGKESG